MKNAEKPILSIALLTSDRMKTIPRCLDSLIPLREAIPCELIITDTSKNPEVHALALSHTDLVEEFEWCNDFAKARNVGVAKAKGEWFMFVDDDEWFMEIDPIIEFFKSGEYKNYGYAHYKIRNYHDAYFETFGDGWVTRLVKLGKDTKFHSKVHEYLAPVTGKDKVINALAGHSGYAFTSNEAKKKHFHRNSSLLKEMEKEEPDNLRWKVQQIQEYRSLQDWKGLKTYCEKTIEYLEVDGKTVVLQDLQQIYIGYVIALNYTKEHEKVVKAYKKYEDVFKGHVIAKAFMDIGIAEAYYYLKEYDLMYEYANKYLNAFKEYNRHPEKYKQDLLRLILSTVFSDERYCNAYSLKLKYAILKEDYKQIPKIFPELRWGKSGVHTYYDIPKDLITSLLKAEEQEMLKTVLQAGLGAQSVRYAMMKAIISLNDESKESFLKVMDIVKTLDIETWYKPYAALLTLSEEANKEEVYAIATSFIKMTPNALDVPKEIRDVLTSHGIEVEGLYREIDFMSWKDVLIENLEKMQMDKVEELKQRLEESSLSTDVRFGYFMIIYCEQKLLNGVDVELKLEEYSNLLYLFSEYTTQTYDALFAEELQKMDIEELPENYQAAMWLKIYFEEVDKDLKSALACLGKVTGAYPMLSSPMRYYINCIKRTLQTV